MSTNNPTVDFSTIENFLNGSNPLSYVVSIEGSYHEPFVRYVINDPEKGKLLRKEKYKPFIWFKKEIKDNLYGGSKIKYLEKAEIKGIRFLKLKTSHTNGYTPERILNGYTELAICERSYSELIQYFKDGGFDISDAEISKYFFAFTPVEQFMIQKGVRLFKGMDDYSSLHRFQFDLETKGLNPEKDEIFMIGMRDNQGFEMVLETVGETLKERRDSERENIRAFFEIISEIKPDIISGYNSESFDWNFLIKRCERLQLNIFEFAKGVDDETKLKRKASILKLGNEVEAFNQTYLYGYNVIDIAHSVRRAQAINSDIKSWGLKYITQYSDIAKKNRVYVQGDKIYTLYNDKINEYAFNDNDGNWYKISENFPLKEGYEKVTGSYIVQRYLLDDLWETEQIDTIFNQAAFLISKLLPTSYSRSTTMGTATQWKLIMAAWSYENKLAIPETESKRDFTGGLSRLLEVGYAKNVVKLDYAALYPKNQLTHKIFPDLDISGVMEGLLTYVVDTRDKFKNLTGKHKQRVKELTKEIENNKNNLSKEELQILKRELAENKSLANLYDKKQLPLKILANSWFGAYGAPYIFNWGDSDCAEETTCRGRQYLRLMVKHFTEKYNFKPLVGDTDGFNFAFPDNIDEVKYTAKGTHWKTEEYANVELTGLDAVLAEFNETYMKGRMGLDIDDICNSTINFSRKNYANDINGKIKFVGNSIKSKKMPSYIEDFLNKAIRLLLDGKGKEFINYYYQYVDEIYNFNIPIVKIASKSKVKILESEYKIKSTKKNKAGNPMPRQAHMELALMAKLPINLGDVIYYVNIGKSKTQGDIKTIKKENGTIELEINCELIDQTVVEVNNELIKEIEHLKKSLDKETDETKINEIESKIKEIDSLLLKKDYNVAKYLDALNKKVKPLLVCFHPDIRNKILLDIKKDKKTNLEKLSEKNYFSDDECVLVSGMPNKKEEQDTYEELMTMEDKEIKFWKKVNKVPNNIDEKEWYKILSDYDIRMEKFKQEAIENEKELIENFIKKLEHEDLEKIKVGDFPENMLFIVYFDVTSLNLISRKWDVVICHLYDLFKYEKEVEERYNWYKLTNNESEDRYNQWLEFKEAENLKINEETIKEKTINVEKIIKKQKRFEKKHKKEFEKEDVSYFSTNNNLLEEMKMMPNIESDEWNF